ncbi:MAG: agmatinase family protein [Verrucomicrobia bacterium]|jgi:agmatinase|nr:agmatinase family protein [Verrucomicrobiota bacterium]
MSSLSFDPNGVGIKGTLFGLPAEEQSASVILLPVPWEVTVSYGAGTALGPAAILDASAQLDLADPEFDCAWEAGYVLREWDPSIQSTSTNLRKTTTDYISSLEEGRAPDPNDPAVKEANQAADQLKTSLKKEALNHLKSGKLVGLVGGDHSTPLGLMEALAEHHGSFGILQIDAHADLRPSYEGFEFSHASIMWNALKITEITRLVQVGIRDLCQQELDLIRSQPNRIQTFFDAQLKEGNHEGQPWKATIQRIVETLPDKVYISFDIDGLDPKLCPHTGTPVPGGLAFHEAVSLIREVVKSGRTIIGFDLNEVAPGNDEWDANVGARVLYKLCCWSAASQGKLKYFEG